MEQSLYNIIEHVVQKYPFLSIGYNENYELSECEYTKIGNLLFLFCMVDTYSTPNYLVLEDGVVIGNKDDLLKQDKLDDLNSIGYMLAKPVFDISSPDFNINGKGYGVAVIDIATIGLLKLYYFTGDWTNSVKMQSHNEDYIVFNFRNILYVLFMNDINADHIYMSLRGERCKCYDNYLLTFPDDNYDVSESISIIDLKNKNEYILSWILEQNGIKHVEISKTYLDLVKREIKITDVYTEKCISVGLDKILLPF